MADDQISQSGILSRNLKIILFDAKCLYFAPWADFDDEVVVLDSAQQKSQSAPNPSQHIFGRLYFSFSGTPLSPRGLRGGCAAVWQAASAKMTVEDR